MHLGSLPHVESRVDAPPAQWVRRAAAVSGVLCAVAAIASGVALSVPELPPLTAALAFAVAGPLLLLTLALDGLASSLSTPAPDAPTTEEGR